MYSDAAFFTSALVLLILPIIGCSLIQCEPINGSISISSIIHRLPLATTFSFFGATFLLTLVQFQIKCKKWFKMFLAVLGAKCLSVPLLLPLNSMASNSYHSSFAFAGFILEMLFIATIVYEIHYINAKVTVKGAVFIHWFAAVAVAAILVVFFGMLLPEDKLYKRVYIIIGEYLAGVAVFGVTKVADVYQIY